MTRVFEANGTERSMEWLAANYDGCTVLPARVDETDGQKWQLDAIYMNASTGEIKAPALFKAETRRNELPVSGQPVAFIWPSLANPAPADENVKALPPGRNNWSPRAVVQRTDGGGMTGFGLGQYYGPLYHAWVMSSAPSDCLTGTGMKGGTDHHGPLHGVWSLTPVTPVFGSLRDALLWHGAANQAIQLNPDAALQKEINAAGFQITSDEFPVEFRGVGYVGQRAERLSDGAVRMYYAELGRWDDVRFETR